MKKRKYIYLTGKDFDGTVFITQVVDWLKLYQQEGIDFAFYKVFFVKDYLIRGHVKEQIQKIKRVLNLTGHIPFFPSRYIFAFVNSIMLYLTFRKYFIKNDEVLIFSRDIIGKEIDWLKKLTSSKVIFYFDGRAASAEENRYSSIKEGNFSFRQYQMIAHISYTEYRTVASADMVFTVSNRLKDYFIDKYDAINKQFILYPCLSDGNRFYYDLNLRKRTREELGYASDDKVFLYSGGITSKWHLKDRIFQFFMNLNHHFENSRVLFLTTDVFIVEEITNLYPNLIPNIKFMSVDNLHMINYLNAADFGILFRENTIMNNVASPTKFAEYMLCGLPVIISEGVGDYSTFTLENDVGVLLKECELKNFDNFDFAKILNRNFERSRIAELGKKYFSKQSIINTLIEYFKG